MKCPKCGYGIDKLEEMKIKYKEANEYYMNNVLKLNTKAEKYLHSLDILYNCIRWMELYEKSKGVKE